MRFKDCVEPERELTFAVAGLRQGCNHIRSLVEMPNCRVVALCDRGDEQLKNAQKLVTDAGQPPAEEFHDLDEMLGSIDVDAVCMAMPIERWASSRCSHSLPS